MEVPGVASKEGGTLMLDMLSWVWRALISSSLPLLYQVLLLKGPLI